MTHNNSSYCTGTDSPISFSNRDHLEWNQKKQDMILNLGLTNSQSETDQTPTPTRFIRNCEEVGLFQDLQNVNPFDEEFQKAVKNPRGINLQVPATTSDDTLHTPQIYPELDECPKYPSNRSSSPDVYSLSLDQRDDDDDNPLIIVLEPEKENETLNNIICDKPGVTETNAKERIKAALTQKSGGITPVPIDKLLNHKKESPKNGSQNKTNMAELLKQREANKAAQSRCRKRKQREFDDMKAENKLLKSENVRLIAMNLDLHQTIRKLQEELREAKSSNSACSRPSITISQSRSHERTSAVSNPTNQVEKIASSTSTITLNSKTLHSSEKIALQSNRVAFKHRSSTSARVILSKQANNTPGNLPNAPIAPKNVVVSLPVPNINSACQILPNIQRNSSNTVVLVYPVTAPPKSVNPSSK